MKKISKREYKAILKSNTLVGAMSRLGIAVNNFKKELIKSIFGNKETGSPPNLENFIKELRKKPGIYGCNCGVRFFNRNKLKEHIQKTKNRRHYVTFEIGKLK